MQEKKSIQVEDKEIQTDKIVPQQEKTSSQQSEKKTGKETSTSQPKARDLWNDLNATVLQKKTYRLRTKRSRLIRLRHNKRKRVRRKL